MKYEEDELLRDRAGPNTDLSFAEALLLGILWSLCIYFFAIGVGSMV